MHFYKIYISLLVSEMQVALCKYLMIFALEKNQSQRNLAPFTCLGHVITNIETLEITVVYKWWTEFPVLPNLVYMVEELTAGHDSMTAILLSVSYLTVINI